MYKAFKPVKNAFHTFGRKFFEFREPSNFPGREFIQVIKPEDFLVALAAIAFLEYPGDFFDPFAHNLALKFILGIWVVFGRINQDDRVRFAKMIDCDITGNDFDHAIARVGVVRLEGPQQMEVVMADFDVGFLDQVRDDRVVASSVTARDAPHGYFN